MPSRRKTVAGILALGIGLTCFAVVIALPWKAEAPHLAPRVA